LGQAGHKRRDQETQDDIKAGKQRKLLFCTALEIIDDPASSVTTSVDPLPLVTQPPITPPEQAVIHEVLDEEDIFVERFSYGDLLADKIAAARASLRELLRQREVSCPQKSSRKACPMKKKRHSYSKDQRKLVIDFFERLPGKIQDRISKIKSIPGYEKITHKNIRGWAMSKKRIGRVVSVEFESEAVF
jgi:hypothetical protein